MFLRNTRKWILWCVSWVQSALYFSFYDQFERYQIRNLTKSREIYYDLLNKTTSQVNQSVADEVRAMGKKYLEKLIFNPVMLARKKILVLIEYNNQTYQKEEIKNLYETNEQFRYYKPFIDSSMFWTFEANYTTQPWLMKQDILEVDIDLDIVDTKRTKSDRYWKGILLPELTLMFNNMGTDNLKEWIYFGNNYELWITGICLIYNLITRYWCMREGKL